MNTTTTRTSAPLGNIISLGFTSEWRPSNDMTTNRTAGGILYGLYGAAKINSTDITSGYNIAVGSAQGGYFWVAATKGASHTGTVTITSGYGVRIVDAVLTGTTPTITTLYGLHLATQTKGATNWQIYSAGGDSALGGNTRFGGTTAPTVALDVTGAGLFSSTLGVEGVLTAGSADLGTSCEANAYTVGGVPGVSGSFTTVDSKTVTVVLGLITSIV